MGWHSKKGTAVRAPEIFFNHSGAPSWSSKKVKDISVEEKTEIIAFAKSFAFSYGEREGLRKEAFTNWNLFHQRFLAGEPYQLFADHLAAGYAAGVQERTDRKLDEVDAAEQQAREVSWQRDMETWGDHVAQATHWTQPKRSQCETLGRTTFDRWLLSWIARRVLGRKSRAANLRRMIWAVYWPCWRLTNRFIPLEWRCFPGRMATTFHQRQPTMYSLYAKYYASDAYSKQPRFTDRHRRLSRLEALALTWHYSRQGAYEIEVAGYLQLRHYPYTGTDAPLPVERLGWTWSSIRYDEPYLAWPSIKG